MLKILAMAAMLTTQTASPPAPPAGPRCLTRAQAGSMGVVGAAIMVNVTSNACRRHLRPGAFLLSASGTAFLANIKAEGRRQLPSVLAGMASMARPNEALSTGFFRGFIQGMMAEDAGIDWANYADPLICRDADDMISVMATLSPDQIGRFTGAFLSLSDRMSRTMVRAMRDRPPVAVVPAPAPAGPRPRPLSFEDQGRNARGPQAAPVPDPVPVPVIITPGPPAPPPPPRPPLICPDPA